MVGSLRAILPDSRLRLPHQIPRLSLSTSLHRRNICRKAGLCRPPRSHLSHHICHAPSDHNGLPKHRRFRLNPLHHLQEYSQCPPHSLPLSGHHRHMLLDPCHHQPRYPGLPSRKTGSMTTGTMLRRREATIMGPPKVRTHLPRRFALLSLMTLSALAMCSPLVSGARSASAAPARFVLAGPGLAASPTNLTTCRQCMVTLSNIRPNSSL